MKIKNLLFLILSFLFNSNCFAQIKDASIIRGPYLQVLTPNSVIIRWRTDKPQQSIVLIGNKLKNLNKKYVDQGLVTEHEIIVNGLKADEKYFYAVGGKEKNLSKHESQYFKTFPLPGSTKPFKIWALGDFGNSSQNQLQCRDAILKATFSHRPDVWLWLGDNAYNEGKDEEFQQHVFDVYQKDFLPNMPFWATPGNHDYGDQNEKLKIPYFNIFSMPQKGEAGGLASGSKSYYSFNYGNVHFVSLDSQGELDGGQRLFDTTGNQVQWLIKDLSENKMPWTMVFWHHPPYSKGSHDSDTELQMVKIRENFLPVLEKFNVDIVLSGHSHVYERTYPILGHYGLSESFDPKKHIVEQSSSPNNYIIKNKRQGIIYIVNGSGGQLGGQEPGYPLKAAVYSNNTDGGSMLFEANDNKLSAQWLCADGIVRDKFTITKEK